jgi:hypothetical protein
MERVHHRDKEDADHHRNRPRSNRPANALLANLVLGMCLRSGCGWAGGGKFTGRDGAARASGLPRYRQVALLRVIGGSAVNLRRFIDEVDVCGQ